MTGRANRTRGANAERAVAAYLRDHGWPNARRCLAGDGNQHTDIDGIPGVSVEVKDRANSSWPTWRHQAVTQAHAGDVVVVVRRTRGVTDVGQWEAQITEDVWWDRHYAKCNDRACTFGAHGVDPVYCPRTDLDWVRITVADVVALLTPPPTSKG